MDSLVSWIKQAAVSCFPQYPDFTETSYDNTYQIVFPWVEAHADTPHVLLVDDVVLPPGDMHLAAKLLRNKLGDMKWGIPVQYEGDGMVNIDDEVVMVHADSPTEQKVEQATIHPRLQEVLCVFSPFQEHPGFPVLKLINIPEDFTDREVCLDQVQILHKATQVPVFTWPIARTISRENTPQKNK